MSGTLAQHRPGNKPLFIGGQPVYKHDEHGNIVTKWVTTPGGVYKNGRCVEWNHVKVPVQLHVLDYTPEYHRPSKHARGRMRPRTAAERTRVAGLMRRAVQARKSMTVDINRLSALNLIDPA